MTVSSEPVTPIISVEQLVKHFTVSSGVMQSGSRGTVHAVDNVSFDLFPGESLGIVGESGCGKSTIARMLLRLHAPSSGRILFDGRDISGLRGPQLREYRSSAQMIFQDHATSLNPRMTVEDIVAEPLDVHGRNRADRGERVAALLDQAGLSPRFSKRYPHQLSGGERQRVAIARAIALNPAVIIADEPVSALDISVRAQILNLLDKLKDELGLSCLFISHDLAVVRYLCDRVAVMYLGKIVESAPTAAVFDSPRHPYTLSLLSSVPLPDPAKERTRERIILSGEVPSALFPPPACRFHPRCPFAQPICGEIEPALKEDSPGHLVACHFPRPVS